jgi:dTMP kinase
MRGKLIVIEGTDCSGKETQTKRLISKLREKNIFIDNFSFPNYASATGKVIAGAYLGKEGYAPCLFDEGPNNVDPKVASLYYTADRIYNIGKINLLLENGRNVILDRYIYSNMAHQGGKIDNKEERFQMYDWLDKLEFDLASLPKPDIAIFLHMPTESSMILKANRKEPLDGHERSNEYLKKAENAYKEVAQRYNMYTIECTDLGNIKSIEEINNELYSYIIEKLQK